jgi:hypothetical protein
MVGVVAFAMPAGFWPRLFAGLLLLAVQIGAALHVGWYQGPDSLKILPVLCLLAGSGSIRWYLLPVFAVATFLFDGWNLHLAWSPTGLLEDYADLHALNLADYARFLLSPTWLCTLATVVGTAVWGGRFLKHELRRTALVHPSSRAFLWAGLAAACMGLREPLMLYVALVIWIAGLLVLLFDAAGAF